jgi:hypothetical protein
MRAFLFLLFYFSILSVSGQQQYKVLPWRSELTFNNYLLHRIHAQYDQRRERFQRALKNSASITAYRDSCRLRYKQILGALPERTELKPLLTGSIQKKGYRIEKIIYESIPRHRVAANFYIPDGNGPFPAVLLLCGHEPQAKAADSYQKTAILFALNGFAVLVVDPISQGERHQLVDNTGKPLTRGGTTEHTLLNAAASLVGTGTVAFQLWDNIRGLDYLETRPEVDRTRIGCVGNSGGGNQTNYLIAFDDRIKVAAPCSYISNRERNFDLYGANDGCQHIINEGKAGLEIIDFSIMFAPKPLLILAGRYDFVDYTGTQRAFNELQNAYKAFGSSEKVKFFTFDDGHGISQPKRETAVTWFRKWLCNDSTEISEKDLIALPMSELLCTNSGDVSTFFTDETSDAERLKKIAGDLREQRSKRKSNIKDDIKSLLNISNSTHLLTEEVSGKIDNKDYTINKVIVRRQNELPLPVLTIYPNTVKNVIVWLNDKGKGKIADSTSLIKSYLASNTAVVIADLAGFGELADPEQLNDPKYFNKEYRNAVAALHIGSSLQSERAKNILVLIDYVSQQEKLKRLPVQLIAKGAATIPALHFSVIDERISSLVLYNCVSSFEDLINNAQNKEAYSLVIPHVLQYYDVTDLKKAVGKRLISQ